MAEQFECDGCGECCRRKLVDVFEEDILREPRVGEQMSPLREPGLDGEIGYLNCGSGGSCFFLDGENRCGIYPTRPVVCVLFSGRQRPMSGSSARRWTFTIGAESRRV
jgi:Fe-S-cluster containining protein